jgi:hypothetical protein
MTGADVEEVKQLHDLLVTECHEQGGKGCFLVNHHNSANSREKAQMAPDVVECGRLGPRVQHILVLLHQLSWKALMVRI